MLATHANQTFAWCVLPNHYHALVEAADIKRLVYQLGRLHGRTSHAWNGEERTRGRKVFFRAVERAMRSDRHYRATLNYIHHNPVRHGYVERWTDWPWSSAAEYLAQTGASEAKRAWRDTRSTSTARIGIIQKCGTLNCPNRLKAKLHAHAPRACSHCRAKRATSREFFRSSLSLMCALCVSTVFGLRFNSLAI